MNPKFDILFYTGDSKIPDFGVARKEAEPTSSLSINKQGSRTEGCFLLHYKKTLEMKLIKRMEQEMNMMDIRELALKYCSKHEFYTKLSTVWHIYLPEEADVNSDFIADLMQGRKKYV